MLLVFDIGNTKTGIGVYNRRDRDWVVDWRITTHPGYLADEYAMLVLDLFQHSAILW